MWQTEVDQLLSCFCCTECVLMLDAVYVAEEEEEGSFGYLKTASGCPIFARSHTQCVCVTTTSI